MVATRRQRRGSVPKPRKVSFERQYYADLRDLAVAPIPRIVRAVVLPALPRLAARNDSASFRVDADSVFEITDLVSRQTEVETRDAERTARRFTRSVSTAQASHLEGVLVDAVDPSVKGGARARVASDAYKILRVDPLGQEKWLEREQRHAVAENVALIKSIPTHYLRTLKNDLFEWIRMGLRHEEIARRVEAKYISTHTDSRFGVARRQAQLIAVDQVGKFHARLDELRQQHVGIDSYLWRTAQDERVRGPGGRYPDARPSHRAREGKRFFWDDPPKESKDDGHAGTPIRCRCYAEPFLEELEDLQIQATKVARQNLRRRRVPIGGRRQVAVPDRLIPDVQRLVEAAARAAAQVQPPPIAPIDLHDDEHVRMRAARESARGGDTTPDDELLDDLEPVNVVDRRPLGEGAGEGKEVVSFETRQGTRRGLYKPTSGEPWLRPSIPQGRYSHREAASFELDRLIGGDGVVPPTRTVSDRGMRGSVQAFAEGAEHPQHVWRELVAQQQRGDLDTDPGVRRLVLHDIIQGNCDRHDTNFMWRRRPDGGLTPVAIDNGLAFPVRDAPPHYRVPQYGFQVENVVGSFGEDVSARLGGVEAKTVARLLREQGIEPEAIHGTLVRMEALKQDPQRLARAIAESRHPDASVRGERMVEDFIGRSLSSPETLISRDDVERLRALSEGRR